MTPSEDLWDDILGHLKDRVLLPVIGPELVTVQDGERRVTLSRLIGERVAVRYSFNVDWGPQSGLNDAIGAYLAGSGRGENQRLYRIVNDVLSELNPTPSEGLRKLAAIGDFGLFVSMTFDSLLTRAINEVRFGGQPRTRSLWFSPNQGTDQQQKNAQPPEDFDTVVFKLFGEASSMPQYAIHDEDVLEWLHALMTETARLPAWLTDKIRARPLLFLGCQLSNWVGRMLPRMASKSRLSDAAGNPFFIVGESITAHQELREFFRIFSHARVRMIDLDPTAFVAQLHERWRKRTPQGIAHDTALQTGARDTHGSIFISYVREDADAARRFGDALAKIGGDVWLDERRLQPGDHWEEQVLASIRRDVLLFLPLISKQTENRAEGYVFKEWREAIERAKGIPPGGRRFIVPIVLDADYDGNLSRYRQVPEAFTSSHWGRAPGGQPDERLIAALQEAIRDMRRKDTR